MPALIGVRFFPTHKTALRSINRSIDPSKPRGGRRRSTIPIPPPPPPPRRQASVLLSRRGMEGSSSSKRGEKGAGSGSSGTSSGVPTSSSGGATRMPVATIGARVLRFGGFEGFWIDPLGLPKFLHCLYHKRHRSTHPITPTIARRLPLSGEGPCAEASVGEVLGGAALGGGRAPGVRKYGRRFVYMWGLGNGGEEIRYVYSSFVPNPSSIDVTLLPSSAGPASSRRRPGACRPMRAWTSSAWATLRSTVGFVHVCTSEFLS